MDETPHSYRSSLKYLHSMPTSSRGKHDAPVERVETNDPVLIRRVRVPAHPCSHPGLVREIWVSPCEVSAQLLQNRPRHCGLELPWFVFLLLRLRWRRREHRSGDGACSGSVGEARSVYSAFDDILVIGLINESISAEWRVVDHSERTGNM